MYIIDVEKIKKLRIEKGKKQIDVSIAIGYKSSSVISKLENGQRNLPIDKIIVLAKYYNVSVYDLIKKSD